MSEEAWIQNNIQQRRCEVFCIFKKGKETSCKCWRSLSEHPDSTRRADVWSVSKNTAPGPCTNFGTIQFSNGTSKFVRLDLETRMSVVKQLLLDVWNLPDPTWIISVMGDEHKKKEDSHEKKGEAVFSGSGLVKQKELESNIKTVISLFSYGQSMWVTTEGINFGVSKLIGETLCEIDRQRGNTSPVGIFGWGACQKNTIESLDEEKSLKDNTDQNCPSVLYPHHLLVDDGSINPGFAHKSFQDFRTLLETSLTNHSDETTSMPLVILLYGGWSYVIDGIVSAIENNVPIVVLKGTGGFADVLATVYETSKEDPINTSPIEHGRKWTGTVIDDRLREDMRKMFEDVHGDEFKEGQHKLLQCLQKRELITIVNLDDDRKSLAKAIIQALLRTKTTAEVLRIIDYYMPSRMFEGQGTATASMNVMRVDEKGLNEVASLFLFQAINLDLSELVQFIIDYEGVDLGTFIEENAEYFSKGKESDPYKILLQWAVWSGRQNCAALFWKKGNDLLASALEMAVELKTSMNTEENIGKQRELEEHSILFQQRALGLVDECYNDDRRKTMLLIQSQGEGSMWTERTFGLTSNHVLDRCFDDCNKRIFARDAFQSYMEQVWYGKINPPKMGTSKRQMIMLPKEVESNRNKIKRFCCAPVTAYLLNLVFYVAFLVLFAHTLLFELEKKYSPLEGILVFWWMSFVVEEVRQFWNTSAPREKKSSRCQRFGAKLKAYFLVSYWNILDFLCLFLFLMGGVLMTVYHVDASRGDVYQAARVFLSLDIMLFSWRLLQYFAMHSRLGPVLVMIYEMIKDLLPFLAVMIVFIVSQGLAAHALLYPNRDWSPQALLYIPKNAYWNIFGELGLEEIEAQEPNDCSSDPLLYKNETMAECPSSLGQYAVPFLLGMYMLLMNVLLLNIIIARFSFTFATIHEQTTWIAAWQRARVTLEYYRKPPLPPPFNVFFHLGQLLSYLCTRKRKVGDNRENKEELASWERSMAERYLASAEFKSGSERISLREKKETKDDQPIPQRISSQVVPSTSQVQTSSTTANEKPSTLNEGLSKRLKKVESSQKRIERMLDEVLTVIRKSTQPVENFSYINLDDTREADA